jgi:hypothetical protein
MGEQTASKVILSICITILLCAVACGKVTPTPYQATQTFITQAEPEMLDLREVTLTPHPVTQTPSVSALSLQGQISYVYDGTLYLIKPDGSNKCIVDEHVAFDTVSWSPLYLQVVYYSYSREGLVMRDMQTGNTEIIALEKLYHIKNTPQWSSDGQMLIYSTYNLYRTPAGTIQMYDVSRKELTVLSDETGNPIEADYAIWGASQSELLLTRSESSFQSLGTIFRYNLLSHSEEQLAKGVFPVYSPGRTRILYADKTSYGLTDIAPVTYYFNLLPDTENQLPELVRENYPLLDAPVWAPDGGGFAYKCIGNELWCSGAKGVRSKRDQAYILYIPLGTASPRVLATNAYFPDGQAVSYRSPDYGFSPDGQFLVYGGWTDEDDSALFLLDLTTGERTTLDVAPVVEVDDVKQPYPRHEFVGWLENQAPIWDVLGLCSEGPGQPNTHSTPTPTPIYTP